MEIEKKFRVQQRDHLDQLRSLDMLGIYTLQQADQPEQQRNTYYDTPDGLLQGQHYGLRIREAGGRRVATLKGPGDEEGGLFRRGEWEVAADDPHPTTWPEGEARTVALKLLEGATLVPLLTIDTQRYHIIAARPDGQEVAEISLDDVQIHAGDRNEPFAELEIELLSSGSEADIDALEAALRQYIPLAPESRTKLQRGLELLKAE